jgi:transcription initiation factor TFIID subunit TAF12
MGIRWADCLPGTPGYNNGGGQQAHAEEAKQQSAAITAQFQNAQAQCKSDMQSSDLDPIRHKGGNRQGIY